MDITSENSSVQSDVVMSIQPDHGINIMDNSSTGLVDARLRTVDWNSVTEKILLNLVIAHEAHLKTKTKCRTKWEHVVNDLFLHEEFRSFLPVQADSISRKFKRMKKEFENKFNTNITENIELDVERMTDVEELLYHIRREEYRDLVEQGNYAAKARRNSKGVVGVLSGDYISDGIGERSHVVESTSKSQIHDTVRDVLFTMLSMEDATESSVDGTIQPAKKFKLDEAERERILRMESELVAAKTHERLSKTIADLYQDNRDLREEIKRLHKEIEELKK